MKKITLFLILLEGACIASAQSQRLELYEEFSGENSVASATANPPLNGLLQFNPSKIISVKYQSSLPSSSGMNSLYGQNRPDSRARATYYSVPFVPYARFDGKVIQYPPDTALNGNASLLTQNIIDTAYKVNSPFTMSVTHSFKPAYDSVFIQVTIKASQAFTAMGPLTLNVALEEAVIRLPLPTGSNGEKIFYNTMRSLLPTNAGTSLPGTWTNGQAQTYTIAAKIPSYIYDKNQICIVGFVQDDGNKYVQQAALSNPQQLLNDARASSLSGLPVIQCSPNFSPVISLTNMGSSTLTSCTLNYQVDALTALSQPWTGSLASGASVSVVLAPQSAAAGTHVFKVWPSLPNGKTDVNTAQDVQSQNFSIEGAAQSSPLYESFNAPAFPPSGWVTDNPDHDAVTWNYSSTVGGFGGLGGSAEINYYLDPSGKIDYLYAKNTDLSAASTGSLLFNVAYAQYKNENDSLVVEISSDCGNSWTRVYGKGGAALSTAPSDSVSSFTPTATQWRTEAVNLDAFAGAGHVNEIIRFKAISNYGNNLFLDDVNPSNSPMAVRENMLISGLTIYPNPFTDRTTIGCMLKEPKALKMEIYSVLGQRVYSEDLGLLPAGLNRIALDGAALSRGIYFLTLRAENYTLSAKLNLIR